MKVAIIGGGIMGITLGYYLSRQGVNVEIFEASPVLGGLAGPIILEDGTAVDRFYHAILSSDSHLHQLCTDLNIADKLRFKETQMGFYYRGEIHPMNNMVDFLRFPPLGLVDRFRLGMTVLAAQFINDWHVLEGVSVDKWLIRWSGKTTYENIWRPLLRAKFDDNFENTPATYIWARLVRVKSTRNGVNQREMSGHLIGGYITLIKAMAQKIVESGGNIYLESPIREILIENGKVIGILCGESLLKFDKVIATVQTPIFQRMIPKAYPDYLEFLRKTEYLGVIAPLLVLDRPLSGYWTLNITDTRFPFTGVIETTTYIAPEYVGGHHLVYLPKYTAPNSPWQRKSDDEIREFWLQNLEEMFPRFDRSWIRYFLVHRERYVEPIHGLNETDFIPSIQTPVRNLYLVTTAQIYPALTNGESVTRHAWNSVPVIIGENLD